MYALAILTLSPIVDSIVQQDMNEFFNVTKMFISLFSLFSLKVTVTKMFYCCFCYKSFLFLSSSCKFLFDSKNQIFFLTRYVEEFITKCFLANCIYVLDNGNVREKGRYTKLVTKDRLFNKMLKYQLGGTR